MANLAAMRDGVKANLATISGLRTHDTWPDQVNPPAALVRPSPDVFLEPITFSGGYRYTLDIHLIVSITSGLERAQAELDGYIAETGAASVIAAMESDQSLGGAVSDSELVNVSGYNSQSIQGVEYLGAVWRYVAYV